MTPYIEHTQPPEKDDDEMTTHPAAPQAATPQPTYEEKVAAEAKAIRSLKKIMDTLDAQQRARFIAYVNESFGT